MPDITAVKQFLAARGVEVLEFKEPTPTSETAARALGCSPAEIAKTIVFLIGDQPVAVVTSGDMKVKSSLLKRTAGLSGKVKLPQAEEVIQITGYAPGGVCPFLLPTGLPLLIDRSLRRFQQIYPAAGNDHSAVPVTFEHLLELTEGQEAEVCDPP